MKLSVKPLKTIQQKAEEAKKTNHTETFVTEPVYFIYFFCKIQILPHV